MIYKDATDDGEENVQITYSLGMSVLCITQLSVFCIEKVLSLTRQRYSLYKPSLPGRTDTICKLATEVYETTENESILDEKYLFL